MGSERESRSGVSGELLVGYQEHVERLGVVDAVCTTVGDVGTDSRTVGASFGNSFNFLALAARHFCGHYTPVFLCLPVLELF